MWNYHGISLNPFVFGTEVGLQIKLSACATNVIGTSFQAFDSVWESSVCTFLTAVFISKGRGSEYHIVLVNHVIQILFNSDIIKQKRISEYG